MSRLYRRWQWFAIILFIVFSLVAGRGIAPDSVQAQAAPTATPDPLTFQTHKFQTIQMLDPMNGWAILTVTDPHGYYSLGDPYAGMYGYVLHTQDGGQTWANFTPPLKRDLYDQPYSCTCTNNGIAGFFFLDTDHAWIASDGQPQGDNSLLGISVWRTTDGGKSWQHSTQTFEASSVLAFNYIYATHGWMLLNSFLDTTNGTENALLYQTTDGTRPGS